MKRARLIAALAALLLSAAAALAWPPLRAYVTGGQDGLPPGASRARRQLITVWYAGGMPEAGRWLRRQAAAYGARQAGAAVWVRSVTETNLKALAEEPEAAPDLIVFTAGEPAPAEASRACALLCCSGYALAVRSPETAVTPAPRSLFGATASPVPGPTPAPQRAEAWPARILADADFGALALAAMGAPAGGELAAAGDVLRRFVSGEADAALLSAVQAREAAAAGLGFRIAAVSPATDLAVYGALTVRQSAAGAGFWEYLRGEAAQRDLAPYGLIPARADLRLYASGEPLLQALEQTLADGWFAPPFRWAAEKGDALETARALCRSGAGFSGWREALVRREN